MQVKRSRARPLMGTLVAVWAEGETSAVTAGISRALAAVERVEKRMSYFDPESDVSRLNREAHRCSVLVHPQTFKVLREAQRLFRLSQGVFDVTVGQVLAREGFLPPLVGAIPRGRHSFGDVRMGPGFRVRFRRPLWIDLGGIAKGFAVDQALSALRRSGVKRGGVNAGGDLAFFSDRPEKFWVRHPCQISKMISLGQGRAGAVASSAPTYSARGVGGGRVSSPYVFRGQSVTSQKSVTVVARRALWADALTKVVLLAPDQAGPLLRRFRAEAFVFSSKEKSNGQ
ncbi:MAG: FAD:protein FMN transferase [Elusimicrobia bacterium]|nr:FAD:protein FMN transferase [Elusimicrobiota bacterium]